MPFCADRQRRLNNDINTERLVLLSIDPGAHATGYAVLTSAGLVLTAGVWIPRRALTASERLLLVWSRLQDLVATHQPGILVYEEFAQTPQELAQAGDAALQDWPVLHRLIGGMQALALMPPYPVLWPLLPFVWPVTFLGKVGHAKQEVAHVVNARCGTQFKGDMYDNHATDAAALGLVALEQWQATRAEHTRVRPHARLHR